MACPQVGTCYAVGEQGTILFTGDGGAHWRLQGAGGTHNPGGLEAVACVSARICYVAGAGWFLQTINGGS